MFDLKAFADASVTGIPLVVFVLALTTWVADVVGAQGKQKMIIAMIVGLLAGGGYQLTQAMPASFAGWFAVAVYGKGTGRITTALMAYGRKRQIINSWRATGHPHRTD